MWLFDRLHHAWCSTAGCSLQVHPPNSFSIWKVITFPLHITALVGTWRWNHIKETVLEWGSPGPDASMVWMCQCIQLSRCSWGCCDISGIIPCAHPFKTWPMVLPESVGGRAGGHPSEKGSHSGAAGVSWLMADVFVGTHSLPPPRFLLLLSSFLTPLKFQVTDPWRSYLLVSLLSLTDERALPPRLVLSSWVCRTVRTCNVLSWIPPWPGKGFHFLQGKDNSSPNAPPSLCSGKSFTCLSEGRGHSLVDPVFGYPWFPVPWKGIFSC